MTLITQTGIYYYIIYLLYNSIYYNILIIILMLLLNRIFQEMYLGAHDIATII